MVNGEYIISQFNSDMTLIMHPDRVVLFLHVDEKVIEMYNITLPGEKNTRYLNIYMREMLNIK